MERPIQFQTAHVIEGLLYLPSAWFTCKTITRSSRSSRNYGRSLLPQFTPRPCHMTSTRPKLGEQIRTNISNNRNLPSLL